MYNRVYCESGLYFRSEAWSGILDGTKAGNMPVYRIADEEDMKCIFPMVEQDESPMVSDEDSLHLSIYVPAKRMSKKLAVSEQICKKAGNIYKKPSRVYTPYIEMGRFYARCLLCLNSSLAMAIGHIIRGTFGVSGLSILKSFDVARESRTYVT